MRALITGGHGFAGRHLAQHLVSCGDDVALTYLPLREGETEESREAADPRNIPVPKTSQSLALDITDRNSVFEVVSLLKPDVLFHLAAISHVPQGEGNQDAVFDANYRGTVNLLDAVVEHSQDTRFLYVSSSEVYGEPRPGSLPLLEKAELRPVNNYGVSKAAAELSVYSYGHRHGIHAVTVRPFPHTGPGQTERFALSSFAKQVAAAKIGIGQPQISVGNLEVVRDYSDVSDIVRGYREAALNGKPLESYNLCSGESVELGELLNMLIARSGTDVEVVQDPARVRNNDVPDVYGSYERAQRHFGWKPRVEREAMLDSLLAHWMSLLSSS